MKSIVQYIYYRIAKAYRDIFGIEDAPGFLLIQSCYSWGSMVLLFSICFYLLAIETFVLWHFGIKMKVSYIIITVLPFALFHIFVLNEEREKETFKNLKKKYKGEKLRVLKGIVILLFVLFSWVSFMWALSICK